MKRLWCWVFGHRRGKRTGNFWGGEQRQIEYECARCGARWSRRVKGKVVA